LAGIFNSTTKVLIFSIDLFKVSKYFNSGTFKKFGPKMPSTMIPVNPSTVILMRAIWKKKSKVPELKDFKTLGGQLRKLKFWWSN
jgi:hypothetical protein